MKEAVDKGIRVHVLGVGSANGTPIPQDGTNDFRRDSRECYCN